MRRRALHLPATASTRLGIPWRGRSDDRHLPGGLAKRRIVEVGIARRGLALAVSEQAPDGGEPDAVHDALRGPGVPAVVNAKAGQCGFLPDADPERVELVRGEVLGEYPLPPLWPWKRRE